VSGAVGASSVLTGPNGCAPATKRLLPVSAAHQDEQGVGVRTSFAPDFLAHGSIPIVTIHDAKGRGAEAFRPSVESSLAAIFRTAVIFHATEVTPCTRWNPRPWNFRGGADGLRLSPYI